MLLLGRAEGTGSVRCPAALIIGTPSFPSRPARPACLYCRPTVPPAARCGNWFSPPCRAQTGPAAPLPPPQPLPVAMRPDPGREHEQERDVQPRGVVPARVTGGGLAVLLAGPRPAARKMPSVISPASDITSPEHREHTAPSAGCRR